MSSSSSPVPRWPSLYNPGLEILNIAGNEPQQPGGAYLYRPQDVFRFTLYWTLIFYSPLFLTCGVYAFWNYTFPPSSSPTNPRFTTFEDSGSYELVPLSLAKQRGPSPDTDTAPSKLPRVNERRSRAAFAIIVLFVFLFATLAGSVLGSILLSLITTGLYRAGNFHMSTWIPLLLALMQALIGFLSIWPSIIEII